MIGITETYAVSRCTEGKRPISSFGDVSQKRNVQTLLVSQSEKAIECENRMISYLFSVDFLSTIKRIFIRDLSVLKTWENLSIDESFWNGFRYSNMFINVTPKKPKQSSKYFSFFDKHVIQIYFYLLILFIPEE